MSIVMPSTGTKFYVDQVFIYIVSLGPLVATGDRMESGTQRQASAPGTATFPQRALVPPIGRNALRRRQTLLKQ